MHIYTVIVTSVKNINYAYRALNLVKSNINI